jgi:hypothetical protein
MTPDQPDNKPIIKVENGLTQSGIKRRVGTALAQLQTVVLRATGEVMSAAGDLDAAQVSRRIARGFADEVIGLVDGLRESVDDARPLAELEGNGRWQSSKLEDDYMTALERDVDRRLARLRMRILASAQSVYDATETPAEREKADRLVNAHLQRSLAEIDQTSDTYRANLEEVRLEFSIPALDEILALHAEGDDLRVAYMIVVMMDRLGLTRAEVCEYLIPEHAESFRGLISGSWNSDEFGLAKVYLVLTAFEALRLATEAGEIGIEQLLAARQDEDYLLLGMLLKHMLTQSDKSKDQMTAGLRYTQRYVDQLLKGELSLVPEGTVRRIFSYFEL